MIQLLEINQNNKKYKTKNEKKFNKKVLKEDIVFQNLKKG